MTTRRHSDTASPASGLDAIMEDAFAWAQDNARALLLGLAALFALGLLAAAVYESRRSGIEAARAALSEVEAGFARDMGAAPGADVIPEPANPEQARKAREAALAAYLGVADEHAGTRSAELARLSAAGLQLDLGESDAAQQTLTGLVDALAPGDALRAGAHNLLGYLHEERGEFVAAGEAYEAAAETEDYPVRALARMRAGEAYARGDAPERAIAAFVAVIEADAELAERHGLVERIEGLEALKPAAQAP